jgi:mono/diheme cytochrome c family protein
VNKWTPLAAVLVLVVFLAMFSLSTPGFSAPDGKAVMEARCGDCHGLEKITSKTKDRAAWQTTVNRMISKGASLNAEEKAALIDYLVSK